MRSFLLLLDQNDVLSNQREVMKKFRDQFCFSEEKTLCIGIEREFFIANEAGEIVPDAPRIISCLHEQFDTAASPYSYELSACQLETKIGPVPIGSVLDELQLSEERLIRKEEQLGFRRLHCEVAPDTMPLDVFPDPSGRYAEITGNMPRNVLLAACQIIGTHIHVGMPNHEAALRVYNRVIKHYSNLCKEGDNSNGRRLEIYRIMAPNCEPQPYTSWSHFFESALTQGFDTDPRRCWSLIRISVHGTIEFRMFGTTPSLKRIASWAQRCHDLCKSALH